MSLSCKPAGASDELAAKTIEDQHEQEEAHSQRQAE